MTHKSCKFHSEQAIDVSLKPTISNNSEKVVLNTLASFVCSADVNIMKLRINKLGVLKNN